MIVIFFGMSFDSAATDHLVVKRALGLSLLGVFCAVMGMAFQISQFISSKNALASREESIKENELPNLMQYLGTSKYMDLIIDETIFEKVSDNTPVFVAQYRVILFFSFCSFVSKNIFNKDTLIFKKTITNRKDLDDFLLDFEDKK